MRKLIATTYIIFFINVIKAQTSINIGDEYVFKVSTIMRECNLSGALIVGSTSAISPVGGRFQVVGDSGQHFIIQFYVWNVERRYKDKISSRLYFSNQISKANQFNYVNPINAVVKDLSSNKDILHSIPNSSKHIQLVEVEKNIFGRHKVIIDPAIKAETNIRYFLVKKSDFDKKVISTDEYSRWTAISGAFVFPFKLRTQTGDFTRDLTLTGIVGIGYKISKHNTINGVIGVGLASVTLDKKNTNDSIKQPSDRAAISISTGLLYQYKQIQIGYVVGWDFLNQNSADNWIYNKKIWMSLGVGVNIFRTDDSKDKPKVQN